MTWLAKIRVSIGLLVTVTLLAACGEALTRAEAEEALLEIELSSQASALTSSSIEISTNFTIGAAAEAAAAEIQTFVESQLPCAAFTLSGATLTIEYGANPGNCTYQGQTYSGTHAITVMATAETGVEIRHVWTDFQNDEIAVDGTATVTWSGGNGTGITRHVVHETTWTRLEDGRTGSGSGDRTQHSSDLSVGFSVDGNRSWTGEGGSWNLAITDVTMRWVDAVPESGSYTLTTPANKMLALSFSRIDSNTINVEIASGNRSFDFDVTNTNLED